MHFMGLFGKKRGQFRLSYGFRSLTFTPLGKRTVIITVLIGVAAVNSGSNLLYLVVSMMLSMILVSGIMSEHVLRKIHVRRELPEEIYAGSLFPITYLLSNRKRRIPSFALTVSELFSADKKGPAAFLLKLPAGGTAGAKAELEINKRGPWSTSGIEISTVFPFGLFRKAFHLKNDEARTVFPRIVQLPPGLLEGIGGGQGEEASRRAGRGGDLRGLREYTPLDEARLIHWKASARLSGLVLKEFEAEESEGVCVMLDNQMPEHTGPDFEARFEEAVSLAASAVYFLMLDYQRPVSFVSRGVEIEAGSGRMHFLRIMEALARLQPVTAEPGGGGEGPAFPAERTILVLTGRDAGWAAFSGMAGAVLEAGSGG